MTVRQIYAGDVRYEVTGTGYQPRGEFHVVMPESRGAGPGLASLDRRTLRDGDEQVDLLRALEVAARCNAAYLQEPEDGRGGWSVIGDPTEGALLVAAAKAGVRLDEHRGEKLHEIPFDSDRKAMSIVLSREGEPPVMYTKGAPEVILAKCTSQLVAGVVQALDEARRESIRGIASDMASKAMRVLALAYREHRHDPQGGYPEDELVFAGLVGMIDPPREEAVRAVGHCRRAGIRPVMITGDHAETALAIAREAGIAEAGDRVASGIELDKWSDDELARDVASISVYARVSANHKFRVVKAWQTRGDIVAMTGDGVNDAPAVKAADIGVAMGIAGSDVTKESADMVLIDDNFASIVNAVEEGRGIFDNIQKVVHYLLACNASEILLMLVAGLAGWPAPLTALQILWINLVTDGLPALALGMEPPERDVMRRPPRPRQAPVVSWSRGRQIVRHGFLMAVVAAGGFWWVYDGRPENVPLAQSVAFCIVAYTQLFYSFSSRSRRRTAPQLGPLTNPYLVGAIAVSCLFQLAIVAMPTARAVFRLHEGLLAHWLTILAAAMTPVTAIELAKLVMSRRRSSA
jgi:Ca2+-transporting ATPase